MSLYQDFYNNKGRTIHKWLHYFPAYERHFGAWKNKTLTFIEIGVGYGGSLQMWSKFFGPYATIVGIDINPRSVFEENNIHVRLGSQSDTNFLASVLEEFGTPDIILDDGSHNMPDVIASFDYLYPKLSKNGVYMVEDMCSAYFPKCGGGVGHPDNFINHSKDHVDQLNAHYTEGEVPVNFITENTTSISFYDSIVVYERGHVPIRTAPIVPPKWPLMY